VPLQAGSRTRVDDRIAGRVHAERLPARAALHEVKFCKTADDVRIAYACVGEGPPVVWLSHWLSHLAFNWESPILRHWTEEFAKDHTFIHYDHRGHGLSDWNIPTFSVDAFVRDLEAVVGALALDRFALSGVREAARRRLPTRHVTRSGCLTSSSTAPSRRGGDCGEMRRKSNAARRQSP
jgi:hypothetical protein